MFFSSGLLQARAAIASHQMYGGTSGAFSDMMRNQFGAIWSLYLGAVLYLVAASLMWYRADWLSTMFVRNPTDLAPDLSRRQVVSTGLGLIGVYVLLGVAPQALEQIAALFDSRRTPTLEIIDFVQVAIPITMTVVAFFLITKNLRWNEIFNYSFKSRIDDVPSDPSKDEWR